MATKIEWTRSPDGTKGETINPIIGCSKISAGCKNCFAEKMAVRLSHMDVEGYDEVINCRGKWNGETVFVPSALEKPLKWKKPKRIFVGSMGDLFHGSVIDSEDMFFNLIRVFGVMKRCPHHTFMLLTKRPENALDFCVQSGLMPHGIKIVGPGPELRSTPSGEEWPSNVWMGATMENQDQEWRIKKLLQIPAAVRFVSVEPMLSEMRIKHYLGKVTGCQWHCPHEKNECRAQRGDCKKAYDSFGGISWVVAGCESGPKRRPAKIEWFRSLRDQCQDAGVPFFLKQMEIGGKLVKMPELDGKVWAEFPSVDA